MKRINDVFYPCGMVAVVAACLVLFAAGCVTRTDRTILVVDEDGTPIQGALVIWREMNITIYQRPTGAGFSDQTGEYRFRAHNLACVEAFGESEKWGELWLANRSTGTVALASAPYNGFGIDRYLKGTPNAPEDIRKKLENIRNPK